jgi:hypothetical protein
VDAKTTRGLRGDYFDLLEGDIGDVPDLAGLAPTFSRIDRAIDFDTDASFALPFVPDTFVVRWTGFLRAPEDGAYRFTVGSDDGARLLIDGAAVIDHPRLRSYGESAGRADLAAGVHAVELAFYENGGYASCRLWWSGPSWTKKLVAPEFLSPPADLADFTPPAVASIDPPSGFLDDVVTLRGVGFAKTARVTFRGVPAEVVSATADVFVAKVPVGASTGDVVVEVAGISSRPRPFEVLNLLGLYGEFFKLDADVEQMPDLARLPPYFVRLEPNLDFMEDSLWKLPHDPDRFAARFTGFLYVPAEDDWRITLGSDDGARLSLDGRPFVDLPGLHSYEEGAKTARLAKGFHPIDVTFFENDGEARLALYWQRAADATRGVIPAGFFFAPREVTDRPEPTATSLSPKAVELGGELTIVGAGFGFDPRLVRVVFPGDVWARAGVADDGRIRVRVPYGVEAGELRVEVGVKSSGPLPFAVATPQGLVADYYEFADRTALLQTLDAPETIAKRAPTFSRVETSWQRTSAADWNLPHPMPTFAVRWHGTLAVETTTDVAWILRAAAGAWLAVDGDWVVDCGPWHELEERYGASRLAAGEHAFEIWMVQSGAEPRVQLLYTPPGRDEHLPVPGRWFVPREKR